MEEDIKPRHLIEYEDKRDTVEEAASTDLPVPLVPPTGAGPGQGAGGQVTAGGGQARVKDFTAGGRRGQDRS